MKNCTVSVGLNPIPKQSIHLAKGFAKKYKGQIKSFFLWIFDKKFNRFDRFKNSRSFI